MAVPREKFSSQAPSGLFGFSSTRRWPEAVKSTHSGPGRGIWKEVAAKNIARVQASGYQAAVPYLRKVRMYSIAPAARTHGRSTLSP